MRNLGDSNLREMEYGLVGKWGHELVGSRVVRIGLGHLLL
jgi:hypothetical protein